MTINTNGKLWLTIVEVATPIIVLLVGALGYYITAETRTVYVTKEEAKEQFVSKLELSEKLNIIAQAQLQMANDIKIIANRVK